MPSLQYDAGRLCLDHGITISIPLTLRSYSGVLIEIAQTSGLEGSRISMRMQHRILLFWLGTCPVEVYKKGFVLDSIFTSTQPLQEKTSFDSLLLDRPTTL